MSSDISRPTSISLVILATVAVFYVLVVGKSVLVPLAVAIMIWYVINALSRSYAKLLPWVADRNWVTTLMLNASKLRLYSGAAAETSDMLF